MSRPLAIVVALSLLAAPVAAGAQPGPAAPLRAPSAAECQALQRAVQPALPRPLTRASGRVEWFSGDFRAEGAGCTLAARGTGVQFDRAGEWWNRLQARLRAAGWRQDEGMVADGAGSSVIGFRKGADLYLYVGTEDDDGGHCDETDRTQRPGVDCERTRARSVVTVNLGLARGPARR